MVESYSKIESNELVRGIIYEREEYTEEEINGFRNDLIDHIHELVEYFANDNSPSIHTGLPKTEKEKLNLLAFGILTTIDGHSADIGGYMLVPIPESHIYDPNYALPDNLSNFDIAGTLNSLYVSKSMK